MKERTHTLFNTQYLQSERWDSISGVDARGYRMVRVRGKCYAGIAVPAGPCHDITLTVGQDSFWARTHFDFIFNFHR